MPADEMPGPRALWRALPAVLLLLCSRPRPTRACPHPCACYVPSEVHCTFRSLAAVPAGISKDVERINLGFNSIQALSESSFEGLSKLELLMVHGNNIPSIPDGALRDLRSLQVLKFSYNKVRVLTGRTLEGLWSLVRLHLDHNRLEFIHPQAFQGLTGLRLLQLEGNALRQLHAGTFSTLSLLGAFPLSAVRHLYLADNALRTLPAGLPPTLPLLETLSLHGNPWACDCRMAWLRPWREGSKGIVRCKKDKAQAGGQLCPACSGPGVLAGRELLQLQDVPCRRPAIASPLRPGNREDAGGPPEDGEDGPASLREAPLPPWNVSLNMTDEHGNAVGLACSLRPPGALHEVRLDPTDAGDLAVNATVALDLECGLTRGDYERLWKLIAYYSEVPVRLRREAGRPAEPGPGRRYRQDPDPHALYYTGVRAHVWAAPAWVLQPAIDLRLSRRRSTAQTAVLCYRARLAATVDAVDARGARGRRGWVLIEPDTATPAAQTVLEGSSFLLSCHVRASRSPSIVWTLPDGSALTAPAGDPGGRVSVLTSGWLRVQAARASDSGLYRCLARVREDADLALYRVLVLPPASRPPDGPTATVETEVGDPLRLPCRVPAVPDARLSWLLPDGRLVTEATNASRAHMLTDGSLAIPGAQLRDGGVYRCVAVNRLGDDQLAVRVAVRRPRGRRPAGKARPGPGGDTAGGEGGSGEDGTDDGPGTARRPGRRKPGSWEPPAAGAEGRRVFESRRKVHVASKPIAPERWADILARVRGKKGPGGSPASEDVPGTTVSSVGPAGPPPSVPPSDGGEESSADLSPLGEEEPDFGAQPGDDAVRSVTPSPSPPGGTSGAPRPPDGVPATDGHTQTGAGAEGGSLGVQAGAGPQGRPAKPGARAGRRQGRPAAEPRAPPGPREAPSGPDAPTARVSWPPERPTRPSRTRPGGRRRPRPQRPRQPPSPPPPTTWAPAGTRSPPPTRTPDVPPPGGPGASPLPTSRAGTAAGAEGHAARPPGASTHSRPRTPAPLGAPAPPHTPAVSTAPPTRAPDGVASQPTGTPASQAPTGGTVSGSHAGGPRRGPAHADPPRVTPRPPPGTTATSRPPRRRVTSPPGVAAYPSRPRPQKHVLTTPRPHGAASPAVPRQTPHAGVSRRVPEQAGDSRDGDPQPWGSNELPPDPRDRAGRLPSSRTTPVPDARLPSSRTTPVPDARLPSSRTTPVPDARLPSSRTTPVPDVRLPNSRTTLHPNVWFSSSRTTPLPDGRLPSSRTTPVPDAWFPSSRTTLPPNARLPSSRTAPVPDVRFPSSRTTLPPNVRLPSSRTTLHPNVSPPSSRTTPLPDAWFPSSRSTFHTNVSLPSSRPLPLPDARLPSSRPTLHPNVSPPSSRPTLNPNLRLPSSRTTALPDTRLPSSRPTLHPNTWFPSSRPTLHPNVSPPSSRPTLHPNVSPPSSRPTLYPHMWFPSSRTTPLPDTRLPNSRTTLRPNVWFPSSRTTLPPNARLPSSRTAPVPDVRFPSSRTTPLPDARFPSSRSTFHTNVSLPSSRPLPLPDARLPSSRPTLHPNVSPPSSRSTFYPNVWFPSSRTTPLPDTRLPSSRTTLYPNMWFPSSRTTPLPDTRLPSSRPTLHPNTWFPSSRPTLHSIVRPPSSRPPPLLDVRFPSSRPTLPPNTWLPRFPISPWSFPHSAATPKPLPPGSPAPGTGGRRPHAVPYHRIHSHNHLHVDFGPPAPPQWHRPQTAAPPASRARGGLPAPGSTRGAPGVWAAGEKPQIVTKSPPAVTVAAETDVALPCEATGKPPPLVTWTKVSTGALLTPESRAPRFEVVSNGTLVIRRAQTQDHGEYLCLARNTHGTDRAAVRLAVAAQPPRILAGRPRDVTVSVGDSVAMECLARGSPDPRISWVFPDGRVWHAETPAGGRVSLHQNRTLSIRDAALGDRGVYTCVASNAAGADSLPLRLHVVALPPVIRQQQLEDISLPPGLSVHIHCTARAAPAPAVRWRLPDGTRVRPSQFLRGHLLVFPNGTLYIRNLGPRHSGHYECLAANPVGTARRTVRLAVETPRPAPAAHARITGSSPHRTDVHYGATLWLHCSAAGDPRPSILWRLPSQRTVDALGSSDPRVQVLSNGSLVVRSVTDRDAGDYVCVARNQAADDFAALKVHVLMTPAKIERRAGGDRRVPDGGDLRVDCVATGLPDPEVSWSLPDGRVLNARAPSPGGGRAKRYVVFHNGTLYFREVGAREEGDYTCLAENRLGKDAMTVRVRVADAPAAIRGKAYAELRVPYGGTAGLPCEATGEPPPTVTWLSPAHRPLPAASDKYRVEPDGTLSVRGARRSDGGNYTCVARNRAGEDRRVVRLHVTVQPPRINGHPGPVTTVRAVAAGGGHQRVDCVAEGVPRPRVLWAFPEGVVLPAPYYGHRVTIHRNGTLDVRRLRAADAVPLVCIARNEGGEARLVVQLTVLEPADPPAFHHPPSEDITAAAGHTISLNCSAAGVPPPALLWVLPDGTELPPDRRLRRVFHRSGGLLHIGGLAAGDAGLYRCVARNAAGHAERRVALRVVEPGHGPRPAVTVVPGETLRLPCPVARASWTLPDGTRLPGPRSRARASVWDNGTLTVREASVLDRGTYTCRPDGEAGPAVASYPVIVIAYRPRITGELAPAVYARPGSSVHIGCVAIGVPRAEVRWELPDGVHVAAGGQAGPSGRRAVDARGSLTLRHVARGDAGFYRCTAHNAVGSDSKATYVHVD